MTKRWAVLLLVLATSAAAKPPKLTLVVSVDALGADLLLRMRPRLKGGLAQLLAQAAYYPTARYPYAENVTAAGHATIATGTTPNRHGIISNRLYNRATGREEPLFGDPNHPVLEAPSSADDVSPENLLSETLSDHLRLFTQGRGKAISISAKPRAAVALAGRLGTAWWFNEPVGKFVTGTYYAKEFPAWMKAFNDKKLPQSYFGKEWALSAPAKEYVGDDDLPYESDWYALGRTFPHPLTGGLPSPGPQYFAALDSSPMMSELLVAAARAAIDGEQLGKDDVPDLLHVSFSNTDRIYHLYGPYSWEVQDALIRLDKTLGDLFAAVDKAAGGRGNALIVLTADHGGAAIPEGWKAAGMPAARVIPATLAQGLSRELSSRFGNGDLVIGIEEVDVYLSPKAIADKKLDGAAVRRAAAQWLSRQSVVVAAVARDDLFSSFLDVPPALLQPLRVGYFPERSGDVLITLKPFHVMTDEPTGTSHGSPYAYDAQVPLVFAGKGIRAGVYRDEVSPLDVAPTIAALLEMGPPAQSEGRVLPDVVAGVR